MEPGSSLGPQYQPFYVSDTLDNTMGEMDDVPQHIGFRTSSARDEPVPTPPSTTEASNRTPISGSRDSLEADRLSREYFKAIFTSIDAEVAEAHVREVLRQSYSQYEPAPLYPIQPGISIEDPKRIFNKDSLPHSTDLIATLRQTGGRLVYSADYPPIAEFLAELEQNPDMLQMSTGRGRNVREWTSTNLPKWYIEVVNDSKVQLICRVCFVAAALKVYDKPMHPAHRLFWSNLTCRAQSNANDKQLVWERTAEKINDLLGEFGLLIILCGFPHKGPIALKDDFPVDRTNCGKFVVDIWELQHLTGKEWHTRVKELFPTRWVPELGIESVNGNTSPNALNARKRKAEVSFATKQTANPGDDPGPSPRKRARVVTFAEPSRKSGREVKARILPQTATDEGGGETVTPIGKLVKSAKLSSLSKMAVPVSRNKIALDASKPKPKLMESTITSSQHPSRSDASTRPKRPLSHRKANPTPPSTPRTLPMPSCLKLTTQQSLNRSPSIELGSRRSSTAVSPVGADSRGSSTSACTVVELAVDSMDGNGKRKRVDEPHDDACPKVVELELTEMQIEEEVAPRRTTRARTSKMTAKSTAAPLIPKG